jgi:cystathionine beta-lyase/cystathionine gamma-synthase
MDERPYHPITRWLHGESRSQRWDFSHHVVPPISASSSYRLETAGRGAQGFQQYGSDGAPPIYIYDRLDEPARGMLEDALADAEGLDAGVCFASGMAAIAAAFGCLVQYGDHVVAHRTIYGCTQSLFDRWFPRLGVRVTQVDLTQSEALQAALEPRTRAVFLETIVNPSLEIFDLPVLRSIIDSSGCGARLVVDNTFATPYCLRPAAWGADVIVHSLTKSIGGFGTELGGAVVVRSDLAPELRLYRKDFGGVLASAAAWSILVHGLPTLAVRLERQQATAATVAAALEAEPGVRRVVYPGLASYPQTELAQALLRTPDGRFAPGSMIYFELDESRVHTASFVDHLAQHAYAVTLAVSLGHVKTLVEMPRSMTHSACPDGSVAAGGVRLSIGLEEPADILRDVCAALAASATAAQRARVGIAGS